MSKLNSGKASIAVFILALLLSAFFLGKTITKVLADGDHHNIWVTTIEGTFGSCQPPKGFDACQGGTGTRTRTDTQTCTRVNGEGSDQCTIDVSYSCADLTQDIHGTSHDVSEFYDKLTGDGKHCHRINWDNLGSSKQNDFKTMHGPSSNYESSYNNDIDQNPDANKVSTPQIQTVDVTESCTIAANPSACAPQCPTNSTYNTDRKVCICNSGFHQVEGEEDSFTCAADPSTPPVVDLCTNIDGNQTSVPDGMHINATGHECVNYELGGPPQSQGGPSTQVLGASTSTGGQVLGASTMAKTGGFEEAAYQAIMVAGATLSAFGLKNFKKASKKA